MAGAGFESATFGMGGPDCPVAYASRFDDIAPIYDETRGGEGRGDDYAADIDRLLPQEPGTLLEIGLGTGVVSLGLRNRGRTVVGVDLSAPMLARAAVRLGSSVVRGDAQLLPLRTAGVRYAVAVWVIHDVADPDQLLREAARVIHTGGTLIVSDIQIHDRETRLGGSSASSPTVCRTTAPASSLGVYGARRFSTGPLPTASSGRSSESSEPGRATRAMSSTPSATGLGPPCDALTTTTMRGSPAPRSPPWKPCPKKRRSNAPGRSSRL